MTAKVYSFNIGDMDCTVLLDGESSISLERFLRRFPDASEADYRQAFNEIGQNIADARSSFNILMLKMANETILIDAGEAGKPYGGLLLESMTLAGVSPEDISLVILTHSHGDHILGLLDTDNQPAFPNARYVMSQEELVFWQARIESNFPEQALILAMMRQQGLRLIEMDEQIIDGITAIPLIGHTAGQIGLLIESNGEKLLHLADLLHSPIQLAHPEWSAKFDQDTTLSVPTRQNMLTYASEQNLLTLFYHLDFPSLGYIKQDETGFKWEARQ
ncbi:MAG: MBL fold metallo-hydrolase [Phototrophicaceae bacterium]